MGGAAGLFADAVFQGVLGGGIGIREPLGECHARDAAVDVVRRGSGGVRHRGWIDRRRLILRSRAGRRRMDRRAGIRIGLRSFTPGRGVGPGEPGAVRELERFPLTISSVRILGHDRERVGRTGIGHVAARTVGIIVVLHRSAA